MKLAKKVTFYPQPEVERVLARAPVKKVSERVNELILKGLNQEREESIRAEYERFAQELSLLPVRRVDSTGLSSVMRAAEPLFREEDEEDDFV